jgi:hypothetical protein
LIGLCILLSLSSTRELELSPWSRVREPCNRLVHEETYL